MKSQSDVATGRTATEERFMDNPTHLAVARRDPGRTRPDPDDGPARA